MNAAADRVPPPSVPPRSALRILAVDDDAATRHVLTSIIESAGWTPVIVADPEEAYDILMSPDAPPIALVDWEMPKLSGLELCQKVRQAEPDAQPYLIFVTMYSSSTDIVTGLDAGADAYMVKPIAADELQARVRAGLRTIAVQSDLRLRLREAETIAAQTKPLRETMAICVYCHRVRHDAEQWSTLEDYLYTHIKVKFTHGFCPTCYTHHVKPDLEGDF
jgi:DNA-binding response OmpR family regulator